ncbi:hypothetical protein MTO96_023406 [Rhipicephalus appendiculatus]
MSTGPLGATLLQGDEGTGLAEDASMPRYEQPSVTLPPMRRLSFTERHTTTTEVRVVEEVVATTSSESDVSRLCSGRSAIPLRLPTLETSKGHAVTGEARPTKELFVISASEAEQKEDSEIFIVTDASSDVLPEVLPIGVESPEDSCSRSCGETTLEEGDVVLTVMTRVPSVQLPEPFEIQREPSVVPLTSALDVEQVRIEQSISVYTGCPSEEEGSLPKPSGNFAV